MRNGRKAAKKKMGETHLQELAVTSVQAERKRKGRKSYGGWGEGLGKWNAWPEMNKFQVK